MPIHDWTRVDAGLFHAFHHDRITALAAALNAGALPADYHVLPEQSIQGPVSDILTPRLPPAGDRRAAERRVDVRRADHVSIGPSIGCGPVGERVSLS